jgi:hypothetical protein
LTAVIQDLKLVRETLLIAHTGTVGPYNVCGLETLSDDTVRSFSVHLALGGAAPVYTRK